MVDPAKVLWFSRHDLTPEQLAGLEKVTECEIEKIDKIDKTISSAEEIIECWAGHGTIACVLPIQLLSSLFLLKPSNVNLVVPRNARERNEQGEYYFRHLGWELVLECKYTSSLIE